MTARGAIFKVDRNAVSKYQNIQFDLVYTRVVEKRKSFFIFSVLGFALNCKLTYSVEPLDWSPGNGLVTVLGTTLGTSTTP